MWISLSLASFAVSAQAPGDVRVALVIGNAAYPGKLALKNPGNDAQAMANALRGLGFKVVELRDGDRTQMTAAIASARDSLKGMQGIGMLYYAGHGLQLDWRNYMVPVNANIAKAADVPQQTVDVNAVIDAFKQAGNRMNILVLDACRDNPFGDNGSASGKGLAQLNAPSGTFLAFATAPGNIAEDGDESSGNGLYTQFLLQELQKPTAKIEDVFKRVRLNVRQKSEGRQIPWESTSLEEDFYFNTGKVQSPVKVGTNEKDAAFAKEKADWDKVKDSQNPKDIYAFLNAYPNASISELAQAKLERLDKAKIVAQADAMGLAQNPHDSRFREGDVYEFALKDGYTGVVRSRTTARVTKVTADTAEYTGQMGQGTQGISTISGAVIEDSQGRYDPPYALVPGGEFVVGKRWSGRSNVITRQGQATTMEYTGRVVSQEVIHIDAGTFNTFRLEFVFVLATGFRYKATFWAQPDWGLGLKTLVESGDPRNPTKILRELISRRRMEG